MGSRAGCKLHVEWSAANAPWGPVGGAGSHKRKPPRNAFRLSPRRVFGGKFLSFLAFPPPRTTSVTWSASRRISTALATWRSHLFSSQAFEPVQAEIVFVGLLLVREVRQLHGLQNTVHNHGGPQPGPQPQKEHASSVVTSQCLHGGVVDNLDGAPERSAEIESNPAATEIVRFAQGSPVNYGPWIPSRPHS